MDGAWALYEAWLRLQEGDIEIAVVTGSGRSSTGDPGAHLPDGDGSVLLAPLGVDPVTFAALQARAVIAAGIADERSMAEVALRSRHDAIGNEFAQVQGDGDIDTLLAEDYVREPLRRHDLPPITDGAVAVVLATADRARKLRRPPGVDHGIDHRTECHNPMYRAPRRCAARPGSRPRRPGSMPATWRWPSCRPPSPTRSCSSARCSNSATKWWSTRRVARLASNPIMATGLARIGYAADHIFGDGKRALAHATSGPCLQQNLICILGGDP